MSKTATAYPERADCPCGSGRSYRVCCKRKGIDFRKGRRGEIFRVCAIPEPLKAELAASDERFRALYGRKPSKHDKIIFEQYLSLGDEYWREMRKAAESARIPAKLVFCSQRTGYMVSEGREHLFPDTALEEWAWACAEYDALVADGIDPFAYLDFKDRAEYDAFKEVTKLLDDSVVILGSLIDKSQGKISTAGKFVTLYYTSRAFNSLKLLRVICADRAIRDAVGLSRPIYECMLRVRFIDAKPNAAEAFLKQAEIATGATHKAK